MAFPTKLLADHEKLVFDLRPHWIALVLPVLWTIVIAAAMIVGYNLTESSAAENAIVIVALLMWLFLGVIPFLRWWYTNFVLTTDRLITRKGIIAKQSKEIPLERINDVAFSQSVIERMIGAGDLLIESAGERGQERISNVRDPEEVQLMIYKEAEENNIRMMRSGAAAAPKSDASIPEQIEALARLKDQGVISETEFESKKQELLKRM
jgi:uncharacterized membrane protein YdbT with pleckstrin-like domain